MYDGRNWFLVCRVPVRDRSSHSHFYVQKEYNTAAFVVRHLSTYCLLCKLSYVSKSDIRRVYVEYDDFKNILWLKSIDGTVSLFSAERPSGKDLTNVCRFTNTSILK